MHKGLLKQNPQTHFHHFTCSELLFWNMEPTNMDLPKFHMLKIFLRIIPLIEKPVCEKISEKNKVQMITETKIKWVQISLGQTQRKWLLASLPCFFPLTFSKITERWLSKPCWRLPLCFSRWCSSSTMEESTCGGFWSSRVWLGHRVIMEQESFACWLSLGLELWPESCKSLLQQEKWSPSRNKESVFSWHRSVPFSSPSEQVSRIWISFKSWSSILLNLESCLLKLTSEADNVSPACWRAS